MSGEERHEGRSSIGECGHFGGRYDLRRPPELTAEMAVSRWREVNRLLHSLVILHSELRDRRTQAHVLRSVRSLVGASRGLLLVRDPAGGRCQVRAELGFPRESRERIRGTHRMAAAALISRKPILVARPAEEDLDSEIRLLGGGACLTVPILPGGSPWGVVQLLRNSPFHEEEAVLVWIYVMVLEEALAGLPEPARAAATRGILEGERGLVDLPCFQRRFDEEMERAIWSRRALSLLRIEWSVQDLEARDQEALFSRMVRVLRRSLRSVDFMAPGPEGEIFIALPGTGPTQGAAVAQTIRRNLIQSRALGDGSGVLAALKVACATFPADGASRGELLDAVSRREEEEAGEARP